MSSIALPGAAPARRLAHAAVAAASGVLRMVRQTSVVAVVLLALLGGCGERTAVPEPAPAERQPTVFDDQLKALDKAKAVQQELDEAARRRDEAADAQEP